MESGARLCTIVEVPDGEGGFVRVLPDGAHIGAEISAVTACSYNPREGDRAKLVRIGGRFVVEYAIGDYRG